MEQGKILQQYEKSKVWYYISAFFTVFLFLLAAFLIVSMLMKILPSSAFIGALSFLFLGYFFGRIAWEHLQTPDFIVYENGIEAYHREHEFLTFDEIGDLYFFVTGNFRFGPNNLAFRKDKSDSWKLISAHHSNNQLFDELLNQHITFRVPYLLKQISLGEKIEFHYLDRVTAIQKNAFSFGAKSFLTDKHNTLTLDQTHLHLDGKKYPYTELVPLRKVGAGESEIQDLTGKSILKFQDLNFWSFHVFQELFNRLSQKA